MSNTEFIHWTAPDPHKFTYKPMRYFNLHPDHGSGAYSTEDACRISWELTAEGTELMAYGTDGRKDKRLWLMAPDQSKWPMAYGRWHVAETNTTFFVRTISHTFLFSSDYPGPSPRVMRIASSTAANSS